MRACVTHLLYRLETTCLQRMLVLAFASGVDFDNRATCVHQRLAGSRSQAISSLLFHRQN